MTTGADNWIKVELGDICSFVRSREKILDLHKQDYISTENMLPNRAGLSKISRIPNTSIGISFEIGDILVSNIRPYFKKIWYAKFSGRCSNDILVFRTKQNTDSRFLYYILSDDYFFNYAMSTSKGTKMPRGDKIAIMKYPVPKLDIAVQKKIAAVLLALDDKIELNNKINQNLEQQAQAVFTSYFSNVNCGNSCIGNYIKLKRGRNLSSKVTIRGDVPVVAGGVKPAGYHNLSNTLSPVITIAASGTAGYINLWHIPVWSSDSSYIDISVTPYIYFWFILLKRRQQEIFDSRVGSVQPHIYPKHIEALALKKLDKNLVSEYNNIVTPLFELIGNNIKENRYLSQLCDTLLPKLMSGEIDVSGIEISGI